LPHGTVPIRGDDTDVERSIANRNEGEHKANIGVDSLMNLSAFPKAGELALLGGRAPRWRPGLGDARHSEVFASAREAGGTAAALALAMDEAAGRFDDRSVLWVQDAAALRLGGRPYRPGLPEPLRHRLIHVAAKTTEDLLFALEEGVRCRELAFVIGELAGNPRALDLTSSRRLSLAAEKHGVPLVLVRLDAARDLSSARMRWQVRSAPSPGPRWNAFAPGLPRWHAELFRARGHTPGEWILRDDGHVLAADRIAPAPDHGDLAFAAGDRSLAAG
jgi:protein ImuA